MKHFVIYKEKDRYCSFPHISPTPDGRLAVAFRRASKFSADAAKNGVATHHDPDSSIEIIFSEDGGQTWPTTSMKTIYKGEYGVNDPGMTLLSDGTMLCRFVALNIVPTHRGSEIKTKIFSHRVEHGLVTQVAGNMVMKSTDSGRTWQKIGIATLKDDDMTRSCSRDPIVEMPDGSWLMPVYTGAPQRSDIAWVIRSFDKGQTWQEPIAIMQDPKGVHSQLHGTNYNETSLLHLGNGEMIALTRGDTTFFTDDGFMPVGGVGELYAAHSLDGGLCWSPSKKTGIWGQPGSVIQLSNGDLLATYGYRKKPYGVRCCLSKDKGQTWMVDKEIIIRDDGPLWDLGYPFSLELKNGEIITVYYFNDTEGTRFVAGTKWSL